MFIIAALAALVGGVVTGFAAQLDSQSMVTIIACAVVAAWCGGSLGYLIISPSDSEWPHGQHPMSDSPRQIVADAAALFALIFSGFAATFTVLILVSRAF